MTNEKAIQLLEKLDQSGCTLKDLSDLIRTLENVQLSEERKNKKKWLERRIWSLLTAYGIFPHLSGYQYLKEAIEIVYENPEITSKELYIEIAKGYDISYKTISRNILFAIWKAWDEKNSNMRCFFTKCPGNFEFIEALTEEMKMTE